MELIELAFGQQKEMAADLDQLAPQEPVHLSMMIRFNQYSFNTLHTLHWDVFINRIRQRRARKW